MDSKNQKSEEQLLKELEEINKGIDELEKEMAEFEKNMPKHFKKIAESESFPEKSDLAIKTLERVSQEWFANQKVIKWEVIEPNIKSIFHNYVFPFLLISIFAALIFSFLLERWSEKGFSWIEFLIFIIAFIVSYIICFIKFKYLKTTIKIDRKKQKGVFIGYSNDKQSIQYGKTVTLPAFRLPENDTGTYRKMRRQLQKAITAETGWFFNNQWEDEQDDWKEFLKSNGYTTDNQ